MISIIMPAYNAENYIAEAINSVLNQSYKNWELIIVDDGSFDRTPKIIDEYSKKDKRISVFHRENSGVSAARNFALDNICGEYVTFIDSDDIYNSERLKIMIGIFEKYSDCDAVFADFKEFKGKIIIDNNTTIPTKIEIIDKDILKEVISDTKKHFMCSVMLKSDVVKDNKFAHLRFAEDFCFLRDCAVGFKKIAVLDKSLYYYRRDNENSMTANFFEEKYIVDYMNLVENIYNFCKNYELEDAFYKKMVAHEYAQSGMRVRKCTSFKKFVKCMNNEKFREGIAFANASQCTLFERILFFMIKHKIYLPFAPWIW